MKGVEEMLLKAELVNAEWKNEWEIEIGNYFFTFMLIRRNRYFLALIIDIHAFFPKRSEVKLKNRMNDDDGNFFHHSSPWRITYSLLYRKLGFG